MSAGKINKGIIWGVIASESVHIFCCVLPTIFSILSLLAGMGMIATMPGFIDNMHHLIHDYEIPMIVTSGIILSIGWALYLYSRRINCRTEGTCTHGPCTPQKDRTKIFMIVATFLFIVNVAVYFTVHRPLIDGHHHTHGSSIMADTHHHNH
jgi:hypothetical protein